MLRSTRAHVENIHSDGKFYLPSHLLLLYPQNKWLRAYVSGLLSLYISRDRLVHILSEKSKRGQSERLPEVILLWDFLCEFNLLHSVYSRYVLPKLRPRSQTVYRRRQDGDSSGGEFRNGDAQE